MDGVLVGFHSRYDQLFGTDHEKNKENWNENWKYWVETKQFNSLEWEVGGQTLYRFIKRLNIPFEILSSSGGYAYYDEIRQQKIHWLHKHKFDCPINIVPGKKYKQEYARPDYLIIDDTSSIIEQWRAKGGYAILHDSGNVQNTIDQVSQYIISGAA